MLRKQYRLGPNAELQRQTGHFQVPCMSQKKATMAIRTVNRNCSASLPTVCWLQMLYCRCTYHSAFAYKHCPLSVDPSELAERPQSVSTNGYNSSRWHLRVFSQPTALPGVPPYILCAIHTSMGKNCHCNGCVEHLGLNRFVPGTKNNLFHCR